MSITLAPSLPATDWTQLETVLQVLSGTAEDFQIDLVDGDFAAPASWPFTAGGMSDLSVLATYADQYNLEFDCMVADPEQYLDQLVTIGAKRIVIHYGSTANWESVFAHQADHEYLLGIAITNDVSVTEISDLLPQVDYVQVMGIETVGKQGQSFDVRTLRTIELIKAEYPGLPIAVDGSVNNATIPQLVSAGVTRLAPGSAISQSPNPVAAYKQLVTRTRA